MSNERTQSQYRQVANDLREAILRGDYPLGSAFPSEPELVKLIGENRALIGEKPVSRTTINRALLVLRAEGIIRVERGKRTLVRSVPTIPRDANTRYAQDNREQDGAPGAFANEISKLGFKPDSKVVEKGPTRPPADVAAALKLKADEDAFFRKRHMSAGETPVQIATSYVTLPIAEAAKLDDIETGRGGMYSRLADIGHAPVRFTETVSLRPPSTEEADFLRLSHEHHVLVIFHRAWTSDTDTVEVAIHVLPPHQWELQYSWPAEPPP